MTQPGERTERSTFSRKNARVVLLSPSKGDKSFTPTLSVPTKFAPNRDGKPRHVEPEDTLLFDDMEDRLNKVSLRHVHCGAQTFRRLCKKYNRRPAQHVIRQFGRRAISLDGQHLGHNELKAFFIALVEEYINKEGRTEDDPTLERLDVSGNKVGHREVGFLTEFITAHKRLTELIITSCHMCSAALRSFAEVLDTDRSLCRLDLSDNNMTDADGETIATIIQNGVHLRQLILRHNRLSTCGDVIGAALADNDSLVTLDLSWNHIRGKGAIGLCKSLATNNTLETLNVSWNGFAYEGAAAMGFALATNTTLKSLDLTNNRIHPPALFELLKGLEKNKCLSVLKIGQNPITANTTSLILQTIIKAKECNLTELDLQGTIVDKDFQPMVDELQNKRMFICRYEHSLPLNKGHVSEIDPQNIFNIDPVRILYIMKEHLRTIDLFLKVDKDNDCFLTKDEIKYAFEMEGFSISESALQNVMGYLDTNKDGEVDLLLLRTHINVEIGLITECIQIGEFELREFINGERRLKRQLIKEKEEQMLAEREEEDNPDKKKDKKKDQTNDQKFSQTFTNSPRKLPPLNGPKMA